MVQITEATIDGVTIAGERLTAQAQEVMDAILAEMDLPPAPAKRRKKTLRERLEGQRRAAMQKIHDELFPDGEYCAGCCW